MDDKQSEIETIYNGFQREIQEYTTHAACKKGCAFCCTDAGKIDITTLEGLVIQKKIASLPRVQQVALKKRMAGDMKKREKGQSSPCPFLLKNKACLIYEVRPFSCRRIYSVHACNRKSPPMLSRQVIDMAARAIKSLQCLDDTGYSGHITYILHMLEAPRFLSTYLAKEYKPEEVMQFGKSHQILINRMAAREQDKD